MGLMMREHRWRILRYLQMKDYNPEIEGRWKKEREVQPYIEVTRKQKQKTRVSRF